MRDVVITSAARTAIGSCGKSRARDMYMARVVGMTADVPKEVPACTTLCIGGGGQGIAMLLGRD